MLNLTRIISSLKSVFPSTGPRKIISIHLGMNSVKAVVVKRKGKKAVIVSSAEIKTDPDALYDISKTGRAISSILNDLGSNVKQGIIVTDRVKFLASELAIPPGIKLSEERLSAAVAWEIEPYLDFPAGEGIFDYRLIPGNTGQVTTPALISAMAKGEFKELAGILKDFRISLRHAYSQEGALAFSSWVKGREKERIAVNCGQDTIIGMYLKASEDPFLIQRFPLEPAILFEDQIASMVRELSASSGEVKEIIIAGDTASEELAESLQSKSGADVRIWSPEKEFEEYGVTMEITGLHPGYAVVIGAALQELGFAGKPVAVTGRVSSIKRVRDRAYLAPAVALAVIIVCFTGHYALVKHRIGFFASDISALEGKKKILTRLRDERVSLQKRQSSASQKRRYLEELLPARQKNLLSLLTQIPEAIPCDMILENLTQNESADFSVTGFALHTGSIGLFAGKLSKFDGCEQVKIKSITGQDKSGGTISFPYAFCIKVVLKK